MAHVCWHVITLPMLPIEEVMKANFNRLTTSHQGDVWPPVSMASREPEMMSAEEPGGDRVTAGNAGRYLRHGVTVACCGTGSDLVRSGLTLQPHVL